MNCDFDYTAEVKVYRCTRCGREMRGSSYPPDRCFARCGVPAEDQPPKVRYCSDEEHAARLAACQACAEHLAETDRCKLLRGCDLAVKRKLRPNACKRGLWPRTNNQEPMTNDG